MLTLAKDCTTINAVGEGVKRMGLVREATIVVKDVLTLLAAHPLGDTNRFSACICGKGWGNTWRS